MDITGNNKTMRGRMYSEPVMTYNHMQEEGPEGQDAVVQKNGVRNNVVMRFIAEELIIALLLALIFYMI